MHWNEFADFKTKMNTVTAAIQGSGWGWLGYSKKSKKLEIVTTSNQDPLLCASWYLLLLCGIPYTIALLQRTYLSSASTSGSTPSTSSTTTSRPT